MTMLKLVILALVLLILAETTSGLKCLSCSDIVHPHSCTTFVTCYAGEVCGTEKYVSHTGDVRYTLDCAKNETCLRHNSNTTSRTIDNTDVHGFCLTCCHGDLCNSGGCGEQSFDEIGSTVCYHCQSVATQGSCRTFEICNADEVCFLEKTHGTSQVHFTSGCRKKSVCDAIRSPGTAIGRRKRDTLCVKCCNSSLCNNECDKDVCVDQPECASLLAKNHDCPVSQSVRRMCPKSCGVCQSEMTTTPSTVGCQDLSTNCEYLQSRFQVCNDRSTVDQLGCHKTCGLCGNQITSSTPPPRLTDCDLFVNSTMCNTTGSTRRAGFAYPSGAPELTPGFYWDTSGQEFYFTFSANYKREDDLYIYIVSDGEGHFNVTIPHRSIHETVRITSKLVIYNVSASLVPNTLVKERKGIHIESSIPVYVFAWNGQSDTSDGFNVLPSRLLSTHYRIPSSEPDSLRSIFSSQISVVSTSDGNNITFTLIGNGYLYYKGFGYSSGDNIILTLDKLETFDLAHVYSLSGTKVTATKPIAVVSGNICNKFVYYCSHLVDMVPPETTYDTKFIIPKFALQDIKLQLIAGSNDTHINVTSTSVTSEYLQHAGDSTTFDISSTTVLSASHGILVSQYIFKDNFDPSMMIIPGIHQYLSNYSFAAVRGIDLGRQYFENYITVIINNSARDGLILDSNRVEQNSTSSILLDDVSYDTLLIPITPGYHNMYHEHHVTFGLFVFGKKQGDSYAYAAGKHL